MSRLIKITKSRNWYYSDGKGYDRVIKSTGTPDKVIAQSIKTQWDHERAMIRNGLMKKEDSVFGQRTNYRSAPGAMAIEVEHKFDTTIMQTVTARNLCHIIARLATLLKARSKKSDREVQGELRSAERVHLALEEARNWIGKAR